MPPTLIDIYQDRVGSNSLRFDEEQVKALVHAQDLSDKLFTYQPPKPTLWSKFSQKQGALLPGFYLYGDVGRGKSMVMDLFFEQAPLAKKRRVHFHQFMLDVHERLHQRRKNDSKPTTDVIPHLAREMAKEVTLLCFDEFFVSNIADAMILGRLFQSLMREGVVFFITSNWAPDDLYRDGLQRERFLPFIDMIKAQFSVHRMAGKVDYRFEHLPITTHYFTPLCAESTQSLDALFKQATNNEEPQTLHLVCQGRPLTLWRTVQGIAYASFDELCAQPLGAADYLAIAEKVHALFIEGVPVFSASLKNETLRFITLIDELYQAHTHLFMTADAPPEKLCLAENPNAMMFLRTASRLAEMQTQDYMQRRALTV